MKRDESTCPVCDLPEGHSGPHEKTFLLAEASPDWTGSPEQWAAFPLARADAAEHNREHR